MFRYRGEESQDGLEKFHQGELREKYISESDDAVVGSASRAMINIDSTRKLVVYT